MRIFQYISIFLFVSLVVFIIYRNSPHYQIIKGEIYGTYYNIKISTDKKNKKLKEEIKAKLQEIDNKMSVFNEDSEISQLNKLSANKTLNLSQDLAKVLKVSHTVWQQSNGWFDPTLGNLINLWGFGTTKAKIPSDNEVFDYLEDVVEPLVNVINECRTDKECPHCGCYVFKSDLPQYNYVCAECDENFDECEVK